jgi:hypothetical protein
LDSVADECPAYVRITQGRSFSGLAAGLSLMWVRVGPEERQR